MPETFSTWSTNPYKTSTCFSTTHCIYGMHFLSGDGQDTVLEPEHCVAGELRDPRDKENRRQHRPGDVGLTTNRAVRSQRWKGRSWLHLLGPASQRSPDRRDEAGDDSPHYERWFTRSARWWLAQSFSLCLYRPLRGSLKILTLTFYLPVGPLWLHWATRIIQNNLPISKSWS